MNIMLTHRGNPDHVAAQRAANDAFRENLTGGCLVLSAGVMALGAVNQARIIDAVRRCSAFDDDPWDAHDIGDVEVELIEPGIARWRELIFFRIAEASADPANLSAATTRQLVIMLASEW